MPEISTTMNVMTASVAEDDVGGQYLGAGRRAQAAPAVGTDADHVDRWCSVRVNRM